MALTIIGSQIEDVCHEDDLECHLLSTPVQVHFKIRQSYSASMTFTWLDRDYTFNIPAWKGSGIDKFVTLFHQYQHRDEEKYGRMELSSGCGMIPVMSVSQKRKAVLHGCQDVMACLHKILGRYQSSVMDYGVWYRECQLKEDDYSSYITMHTCHCIVHSRFFSSKVPRELVKF